MALVEDLQERLADPFLYIAAVHTGIATVHTYAYFDALKNARNMRTVAEGYGGNACPKGSPRSSSPAAAENFVAPRALPKLTAGTEREMLGETIGHVKSLPRNAAQRAEAFEGLAKQITERHTHWNAGRGVGSDGSTTFLGRQGEVACL